MEFPQYRISSNGKNLYRIISETEFTELQYIGESVQLFHITASTYMDRLRIQDLLLCKEGLCSETDGTEFERLRSTLDLQ